MTVIFNWFDQRQLIEKAKHRGIFGWDDFKKYFLEYRYHEKSTMLDLFIQNHPVKAGD